MTNAAIRKVIVSGALAVICIVLVQGYWLKQAFDLNTQAFEEKVHICLRNVAEELSRMQNVQLPTYGLVNQISENYFIVNLRDAIDANSLEYFLQKELEAVSLRTPFEYGIYDCDTDQMVYGNYIGTETDQMAKNRDLPTYDEFIYYFGVRFPDRNSYLLKTQWIPILFTGILLLAVLFFTYATSVILRQKKLSDLQKDFINNMTHEFKTPITNIKISSEVFLNDDGIRKQPRLYQYAGIIRDQATRLNHQVERVLQIAAINQSGVALKLEKLDLHQLLVVILEQMKSRIEKTGATIHRELQASQTMVLADKLHLSNMINGLLDNALKYSRDKPVIWVSTKVRENKLVLTVRDEGIGIAPEHLKRLGQPFFRVPTGNLHDAKGFGLGLHYFRRMARQHGWNMHISSRPDEGTHINLEMALEKSNT